MIKAVIVDDERKSRESLKILLEDFCENVDVVGLASTVEEAIGQVGLNNPDVVFLDIQMNQETGFDFLNKITRKNFEVIFTTAYDEYALDAIKFSALDYLLKPINIDQLKAALQKVEEKHSKDNLGDKLELLLQNIKSESAENFKLVLPTNDGLTFISFKDILYCEASSNYTIFNMRNGRNHVVSKTLKEYEDLLTYYHFYRIHNSYVINLREIKKYIKGDGGHVIMSNDKALDVSKRRKDLFLSKLSVSKVI
jgi:two-component system LytT family response regulator